MATTLSTWTIDPVRDFIEGRWEEDVLPTLTRYIEIPAKSPAFDPQWAANGHIDRAVALIEDWCRRRPIEGLTAETVRLPGRTPLILLEVPGTATETVLLYGHLDKQPEMVGWSDGLGPWTPVRRGDRLYGRGGQDDGYAVFCALTAIEAVQQSGAPHARCVVLIEACEESGSRDLPAYMEALAARLGEPDLVICLDSSCGNYTDRLESDRLVLRRVTPDDLPFYTRLHALPKVAEHLYPEGRPRSPEETKAWMEYTLASYEQLALGYLAVVRKADGALIGRCGLMDMVVESADPEHGIRRGWFGRERAPADVALTFETELGYTLDPAAWGQGFASEAARCVRDYARDVLRLSYAISAILPQNARSRRVAERSGARAAGQMEVVGLAWDRYVWPLDTGGAPQLQPASMT